MKRIGRSVSNIQAKVKRTGAENRSASVNANKTLIAVEDQRSEVFGNVVRIAILNTRGLPA
jgi:hypothetical protein